MKKFIQNYSDGFYAFFLGPDLISDEKFKMDKVLCLNYLNLDIDCILKMFSKKLVSFTDLALEISLIILCLRLC